MDWTFSSKHIETAHADPVQRQSSALLTVLWQKCLFLQSTSFTPAVKLWVCPRRKMKQSRKQLRRQVKHNQGGTCCFEISFHKKIKGQIPRINHKANSVFVKNHSSLFLPQALTKASKTDVYNSGCVLHADLTVKQVSLRGSQWTDMIPGLCNMTKIL